MKKEFFYTFLKTCSRCTTHPLEKFWTSDFMNLERSGPYCPQCKISVDIVITKDPTWQKTIEEGVLHILQSEEKVFTRLVTDHELIKKHGVSAEWLHIGRKVYIDPLKLHSDEVKNFITLFGTPGKVLVYIPNSHLQRLYFLVPKDALM